MKRVKQIVMMAFASLLAQCVWADQMYVNTFAGDVEIPAGTYGEIALCSKVKATAFASQAAISNGTGSFAQIMNRQGGRVDTRNHTVAGWFKIDALNGLLYAAKTGNNGDHVGYKVFVDSDGKINIGKVKWSDGAFAWNGNVMKTASACITAGEWHHVAIAITKQGDTNTHTGVAQVFVDGVEVSMATTPANFATNLDGETCAAVYIGAGVAVGGFYVDDAVIADATTIKDIATDSTIQTFVGVEPESYGLFYKATKDGETLSGWTGDSWQWDNGATTDYAVGPNALGAVKRVTNAWHPGEDVASVSARTIAMYVNTETMTVAQNSKHTLLGLGSSTASNSDSINIVRVGDKLYISYIKNNAHSSITENGLDISNLKGYHLITLTYDTSVGTTLTIDDDTAHQLVDTADRAKVQPSNGLQIGTTWGGAIYAKGNGLAVAYVMGFDSAFTKSEIKNLSYCYPATQGATGNQVFEVQGGTLTAGTVDLTGGRFNIKRGTLVVPANVTVSTPSIEFGDSQQNRGSGTFGLELDGTINISGSSTSDGKGADGIHQNVVDNVGGVLFGNWEGVGTYNIRGTFNAENNYFQPVYDAHKQTINIRNGGSMKVRGIQLANMKGTDHAVYEMNIEEGGVFEIANKSDTNYTANDMSAIKGAGKVVLSGTSWTALPNDLTRMFATTLAVENNLANGMILSKAGTATDPAVYEIGTFSGNGHIRTDMTSTKDSRSLKVIQSANSTWSGHVLACGQGVTDRFNSLIVAGAAGATEKTLTINGDFVDSLVDTLKVESTGSAKLTKHFYGPIVVDGVLELAGGSWVRLDRGITGGGSVSQTNTNTVSLNANDDGIILEGVTFTQTAGTLSLRAPGNRTADAAPDAIGYIKNATVTSSSTLSCSGKIGVKGSCSITKTAGTNSITSIELSEAGATLALKGMTGVTVTSGVTGKKVSTKAGTEGATVYGLVDENPEPVVPEEGTGTFPEGTVITDADGEVVTTGNTLPTVTGVYTVQAMQNGFPVGDPLSYGVVNAKAAETTTDRVTTAVAVPFKGKTVATLLNTALLAEGDTLMAWVNGNYEVWTLQENKTWKQQPITRAGGQDSEGIDPAEAALKCGQGVWVTTAGQVVTFGDTNATGAVVEITTGHNLLGNTSLENATPTVAATEDQVQLIGETDEDGNEIITRYNKKANGWESKIQTRTQLGNGKWVTTETTSNVAPTVKPGKGYWLIRK